MNNIGTMYEDGEGGLPSDLSQAAKWYEAAAALNLPIAKRNLERIRRERRATDAPSG
jgi:TPR repeat protein